MDIWGATAQEWAALAALSAVDLRPCVCNPRLWSKPTKIRPESEAIGNSFAKRPSKVYSDGLAAGITGHTKLIAEPSDIRVWSSNPDHGAGMIGRTIHAIDIDIDDEDRADEVDGFVCAAMPFDPPARTRPDTGRRLLLFRLDDPQETFHPKIVHHTPHGEIEWLFEGQFFVMAGTHSSGQRYTWPDGIPTIDEIPAITEDDLAQLVRRIGDEFADTVDVAAASGVHGHRSADQVDRSDPAYRAVINSEYFREELHNGALAVICPWHKHHKSTDGKRLDPDPTKTMFFPAGLGGRDKHGFRCMHEGHPQRNVNDFLHAVGFTALDEFDVIEQPSENTPIPDRNARTGIIRCTDRALRAITTNHSLINTMLRYDEFKHSLQVRYTDSNWRDFCDNDYTEIAVRLNNLGMLSVGRAQLAGAVNWTAMKHKVDTAREWIESIKWDGEDRLTKLAHTVLKVADTSYHSSVMLYLFTAMAGRVIQPGVKADMVPILYGPQGVRKSTFVQSLSPFPDSFGTHSFSTKDADAARLNRGKLVIELEELNGLSSKEDEAIKAWLTALADEWVPKYKEFGTSMLRRFVPVATTNRRRTLSDSTGNRRWLPIAVCTEGSLIDTDYVQANRNQLWAQGAHLFNKHGILWKDAEEYAKAELPKFTRMSAAAITLQAYLGSNEISAPLTTHYLLRHAMHKEPSSYGAQQDLARIEMAMVQLGYVDNGDGVWYLPFL